MESKQALRRTAQRVRVSRPPSDLTEALGGLLATATRVASYLPLGSEPGVAPRTGWLLPVLRPDDDLDWGVYDGEVAEGHRGLVEPAGPRLGVDAVATCDLVLVPALLVDRQGRRLGKGGGSYDRALRRATGLTVALLNDGELVDVLPEEPHDVRVAAVATPSRGVVHLKGG
jgi:5-formyltetrahydrofolate cyclo-ligase